MTEKLGRVVRSQWEDIWVLLDRGQEEPHLELRLHNHGRSAETEGVSGGEWIGLPVRLLPDLLQALTQAQDQLRAWDLLKRSQPATNLRSLTRRMDARQFPRVVMDPASECRVVDPEGPEVAQAIIGQIKDVSQGGAQAWLPQRFPELKQVDVFMTIEGVSFRGRAEIVGPDERGEAELKGGLYRHNLRWVALHAQAMAALSRVAPST
jgi:PilZ domain